MHSKVKESALSVCQSVSQSHRSDTTVSHTGNHCFLAQVLLRVAEVVTFSAIYCDWGSGLSQQGFHGYETASETYTHLYAYCVDYFGV